MNEIIKFCNLNKMNDELTERFEKMNLKRRDVYLVKAGGECYICFKEKKNRFEKLISKMNRIKDAIRKWFENMNDINLLIR